MTGKEIYSRRDFIGRSLAVVSATATIPVFVRLSAEALANPADAAAHIQSKGPKDRVLVVIEMNGGNDGLNTIVPYALDEYYKARPKLGIPQKEVLPFYKYDGVGLHPAMAGIKEMADEGLVGIVQGVGYPNPCRSHFHSLDIWRSADLGAGHSGWLGRLFDDGHGDAPQCVAIGSTTPITLRGRRFQPFGFDPRQPLRWEPGVDSASLQNAYEALASCAEANPGQQRNPELAFLRRTAAQTQITSKYMRAVVESSSESKFPDNKLAYSLKTIAGMIGAGFPTGIYYAVITGFDTHFNQVSAHHRRLAEFSDSLRAFYQELKALGQDKRVLTLAFSEFGRRVEENASDGTDHGTAGPVFLFGPMVNPGLIGEMPGLADLDNGDLRYQIDFRSVYASVLGDWLKVDSSHCLGQSFNPIGILRQS